MEGHRLSYPHPEWKAYDFFDYGRAIGLDADWCAVQAWRVRQDSLIVPVVMSDEVYVLNNRYDSVVYTQGARPFHLRPVPGFNEYDRVGTRILWKRIVLRLIVTTYPEGLPEGTFTVPEILRISLVYARVGSGNTALANSRMAPVNWFDVYQAQPPVGDQYNFSEMRLANVRNIKILKEWMFNEGTMERLGLSSNLLDVQDYPQKKTFVCEMDLPDLPHDWVGTGDVHQAYYGHGDICLLVNSNRELLPGGIPTSRYQIKFSGRLYFVDAQ